jgi:putative hemolysin
MIFGDKPADFYSSTEFDLASVFSLPGKKLELSRACIHPDFRNGVVLSLLWRGLGRFAALNQVRFLIGIPSVRTEDPDLAEAFFQYFKARGLTSDFAVVDPIKPLVPRLANVGHAEGSTVTPEVLEAELPSLMKLYFKAGARICGRACHDPAFKCIDFFTILDFKDLAESFRKRYYT